MYSLRQCLPLVFGAENHHVLFRNAGLTVQEYRYYKPETRGLDIEGMLEDIKVGVGRDF